MLHILIKRDALFLFYHAADFIIFFAQMCKRHTFDSGALHSVAVL